MHIFPRSLKGQLILLILVALLFSQAASFLFILDDHKSRMKHEWLHNILERVATVRDVIEATPADVRPKILKSANVWALKYSVDPKPAVTAEAETASSNIRDQIGRAFGENADQVKVTLEASLNEEPLIEQQFSDFWRDMKRSLSPKKAPAHPPARPTYAHIAVPLQSGEWLNVVVMQRVLAPPASPLLVQFATMVVISAVGIVLVLARLTDPLKELARAASALGRGETSAKLDEKGPSEVAETIRAFNEMQDRLTTFVHDRAKMLAALGHDLRTPITSLRLRAEFIEDDEIREPILQTLDEMFEMAEASLSFAREEAAQEQSRLVDVGALVSSVCADLADAGRAVSCGDTASFTMRCRPVAIKRALRNIVENAVAYGHCARVSAELKGGEPKILVDDDGPGIAEADMEKVFKPFVRLEQSRSKETGGVGLGLAIARSIVRSHGGDIVLKNRPEGGLRVIVSFCRSAVLDAAGSKHRGLETQQRAA